MNEAIRLLLVTEFFQLKHRSIYQREKKLETDFSAGIDQVV